MMAKRYVFVAVVLFIVVVVVVGDVKAQEATPTIPVGDHYYMFVDYETFLFSHPRTEPTIYYTGDYGVGEDHNYPAVCAPGDKLRAVGVQGIITNAEFGGYTQYSTYIRGDHYYKKMWYTGFTACFSEYGMTGYCDVYKQYKNYSGMPVVDTWPDNLPDQGFLDYVQVTSDKRNQFDLELRLTYICYGDQIYPTSEPTLTPTTMVYQTPTPPFCTEWFPFVQYMTYKTSGGIQVPQVAYYNAPSDAVMTRVWYQDPAVTSVLLSFYGAQGENIEVPTNTYVDLHHSQRDAYEQLTCIGDQGVCTSMTWEYQPLYCDSTVLEPIRTWYGDYYGIQLADRDPMCIVDGLVIPAFDTSQVSLLQLITGWGITFGWYESTITLCFQPYEIEHAMIGGIDLVTFINALLVFLALVPLAVLIRR